jgi:radical SAM enzyme (TIGR01210 family)
MNIKKNIDPNARDRFGTQRLINHLLADYQKQGAYQKVASRLFKDKDNNKKFSEYSWSNVSVRSGDGMQLQIGTQSYGCVHFRKDLIGCLNCGLASRARFRKPTIGEIVSQVELALSDNAEFLGNLSYVCIQGDGSFLSPIEVPKEAVYSVARRLRELPSIHTVTMETRLDYIYRDLEHILKVRSILAPEKRLEIAIGLESSSEFVRNVLFHKGISAECSAEKIFMELASNDIDILLYVFVKPALLTEEESIFDAIRTLFYVHDMASEAPNVSWTASIQPSFIQPDTFLEWRYKKGLFQPPFLWSIAKILLCGAEGKAKIHLGSTNDYPPPIAVPANRRSDGSICECSEMFYEVLQQYNQHGSIETLLRELPHCSCRSVWLKNLRYCDLNSSIRKLRDNRKGSSQ